MKAKLAVLVATMTLASCQRPPCTTVPLLSVEAQVYEAVVTYPRFTSQSWWDLRRPLVLATLEPAEWVFERYGATGLAQLGAEASTVKAVSQRRSGINAVPSDLRGSSCVEVFDDAERSDGKAFVRLSFISFNTANPHYS